MTDNNNFGLPPQKELDVQKKWLAEVDKMLKSYKHYTPDKRLINYFLETDFDFEIYEYYAYDLTLDAMSCFQAGITQPKQEFNVDYFRCLRKLYMICPEANKITFQREFVKEWQYYSVDHSPYFETIVVDFHSTLAELIDLISEDCANVEKSVAEEFRWLLLVSPVTVLLKLFSRVIKNPSMIDFTLQICNSVDTLFHDRLLKIFHNEFETDKVESLLAVVFRRFVCCCRCEATGETEWENLGKLAIALCKGEKPLFNSWLLLDVVLNEIYTPNRVPTKSVEVLTKLAADILAPENQTPMIFEFTSSVRTKPEKRVLLTPSIIDMLLKLMTEYNQMSPKIVNNCKEVLRGISVRMRKQNVDFDEETSSYILERLNGMPWWVEYTMCTWIDALNVEKRRIPEVVFKVIYPETAEKEQEEEERKYDTADETSDNEEQETQQENQRSEYEKFRLIKSEEPITGDNIPAAYIRSIIELGLFDAESVLELLHTKTNLSFELSDLKEVVKNTLKACYLKEMGMSQLENVRIVVMQVLEVFDNSSVDDHENITRSLADSLPVPVPKEDFPKWTHNIKKSIIIPPLVESTEKPNASWPPNEDSKTISKGKLRAEVRKIRAGQRLEREKLMSLALAKTENLYSKYRDSWVDNREITEWGCSSTPHNVPFLGATNKTKKSMYKHVEKYEDLSPVERAISTPVKMELIDATQQSEYGMDRMKPNGSINDRFASLRRGGPNQVFGGSAKRGGRL
ncbi:unnamed protein product [Caenorhabditis nigoni]|uniref:Edg1 TPR repeats region domain-containing protein n=1 Tax=Caenorhabditis nigoni TaxID=1611254 RepID=A0A2G5VGA3_9PELO|nr:hypothetical protein B9Z55_001534 [Caenorhabditis nigoni]